MINTDFTARLSDYSFIQLLSHQDRVGTDNRRNLSQESDIFCFGLVLLDLLAGVTNPDDIVLINCAKESIIQGKTVFSEFDVHVGDRMQALMVLEIALSWAYELDLFLGKKHDKLLASTLQAGTYNRALSLVVVDGFAVEITDA
ncbi:putative Leucine-rich repeat protein kinase family protein [Hibiscus syriacus]|uniref:Leucine-rich repeat protein kinase family protein n=1 Tax=Hibiscus syriacus TaxID=106335 RepID=A0A6A2ZRF1_HIBSY|nr:putative Leucine-rich repeat protein kinase family protein [Hibiscus syriacus]